MPNIITETLKTHLDTPETNHSYSVRRYPDGNAYEFSVNLSCVAAISKDLNAELYSSLIRGLNVLATRWAAKHGLVMKQRDAVRYIKPMALAKKNKFVVYGYFFTE
ncbi:MAG: hypothetical protein JRJ02_03020 [Deltaproteobacteria bacterium]|nr:hypothetical protein [Deltaproteobacteria bacterium]